MYILRQLHRMDFDKTETAKGGGGDLAGGGGGGRGETGRQKDRVRESEEAVFE